MRIEVIELPFSEADQVKGILSSGVGLALGVAAILGWGVAIIALNKLLGKNKNNPKSAEMLGVEPISEDATLNGYDVDELFNE